jgi:hypothetical protein
MSNEMSSTLFLTRKGVSNVERARARLESGVRSTAGHDERIIISAVSDEKFKDEPRIAGWVNVYTEALGRVRVKADNHVKDLKRVIEAIGPENVVEVAPARRGLR